MAKFATELATPAPVTVAGAVIQEPAAMGGGQGGSGYPTGAPNSTYPNMPAVPPVANNPYGVANTPDEFPATGTAPAAQYNYSPQTFEEKIAQMVPPGVPVVIVN